MGRGALETRRLAQADLRAGRCGRGGGGKGVRRGDGRRRPAAPEFGRCGAVGPGGEGSRGAPRAAAPMGRADPARSAPGRAA